MRLEKENPGALAGATGAYIATSDCPDDAPARNVAQGATDLPALAKATSAKEWRKIGRLAVASARRAKSAGKSDLTYLDFAVLVALSEWLDGDALCFRSYQDLADDCGCSVAAVKGAIKRLMVAGLLEVPVGVRKVVRKLGAKMREKGRPANTYRALVPADFGNRGSQKDSGFSATYAAENQACLDSNFGNRSSLPFGNHGCHHIENSKKGGRALGRASANTSDVVHSLDDGLIEDVVADDQVTKCASGAHEAPLAASPDPSDPDAWRYDPAFATGGSADPFRLGGAPEGAAARFCADEEESYEGRTDDLCNDRIATAEMARAPKIAAVLVPPDDFFPNGDESDEYDAAVVIAEDDLAAIYGDPDVDMAKHLDDASEGLSAGDPDAVYRFRRDLRLLAQGIHPARRGAVWNAHFDIITTFLAAVTGGRPHAEKVVADFIQVERKNMMEVNNG